MKRSLYDRLRPPPLLFDAVLVVGLAIPAVLQASEPGAHAAYSLLLLSPLVLRRVFPVASFAAFSLLACAQLFLTSAPIWGDVGLLVALASIAHYGPTWARWAGLLTGLAGAVLGPGLWVGGPGAIQTETDLYPIGLAAMTVVAAWIFGDLRRTRDNYVRELEERAATLARERDQQASIAAAAERQRIAREMHDVVAHSLSIMVVQADGGRYAADQDPEAAKRTLETIAGTGREALNEMRRLLGLLRTGDNAAETAPQPSAAAIDELVASVGHSGLDVSLTVEGRARRVDQGTGLTLYRIVQEGLTNTLKHGGPQARARVTLHYNARDITVSVVDDGRGAAAAAPSTGQGHGLVGMRERVELLGGTLVARPAVGGGFEVVATVPYVKEPT